MDFNQIDQNTLKIITAKRHSEALDYYTIGMSCVAIASQSNFADKALIKQSISFLMEAIKFNRSNPKPYIGIAYILMVYGNHPIALKYLQQALQIDPKSEEAKKLKEQLKKHINHSLTDSDPSKKDMLSALETMANPGNLKGAMKFATGLLKKANQKSPASLASKANTKAMSRVNKEPAKLKSFRKTLQHEQKQLKKIKPSLKRYTDLKSMKYFNLKVVTPFKKRCEQLNQELGQLTEQGLMTKPIESSYRELAKEVAQLAKVVEARLKKLSLCEHQHEVQPANQVSFGKPKQSRPAMASGLKKPKEIARLSQLKQGEVSPQKIDRMDSAPNSLKASRQHSPIPRLDSNSSKTSMSNRNQVAKVKRLNTGVKKQQSRPSGKAYDSLKIISFPDSTKESSRSLSVKRDEDTVKTTQVHQTVKQAMSGSQKKSKPEKESVEVRMLKGKINHEILDIEKLRERLKQIQNPSEINVIKKDQVPALLSNCNLIADMMDDFENNGVDVSAVEDAYEELLDMLNLLPKEVERRRMTVIASQIS